MPLLNTSLSTYTIGNFSFFFFDERLHIPATDCVQLRLSYPDLWVPVDVKRSEHRMTNFKCQSCVLASIWCHSREHFQQHVFSGTVSAACVVFHGLCVSRHKVRRRLQAKIAKSRWMALKTLCVKEKMERCLRAPITWNEAPMLIVYIISVLFSWSLYASRLCNLCLLFVPFCRILIILWSLRIPTRQSG